MRLNGELEKFVQHGAAAQRAANEAIAAAKNADASAPAITRHTIEDAIRRTDGKALVRGAISATNGAAFDVLMSNSDFVLIRDVGPWNERPTVTNDAERVVQWLALQGYLDGAGNGPRIFYYDSLTNLDELRHDDGRFVGFAPGPQS